MRLRRCRRLLRRWPRGELSYSKVRALTRIASDATEDGLLMIALHGTAHHVERLVKHYRRAEHAEELRREDRQAEGCRFPGCTYHQYVDAHHVQHWADGGETKLSNLIILCRAHHRMVHKDEIAIKESADGGWEFFNHEGRPYQNGYRMDSPAHHWDDILSVNEATGICINPHAAVTRWLGEPMDYDLALFCLFNQRDRHNTRPQNVSAETLEG